MKRILFIIHDLGQGGAEKVLVNLVNNMDLSKFDISVIALFGGGINEQFLKSDIHFSTVFSKEFPGNSHLMKLLTPQQLHKLCVKKHYDIEISYLEGPSARVVSGCKDPNTKLVCWIHSTFQSAEIAATPFRSAVEAERCYKQFDRLVCVSKWTQYAFQNAFPDLFKTCVLYNTVDSNIILHQAIQPISDRLFSKEEISLISVGSLKPVKAYDRLIRIHNRLRKNGYPVHTYLLGRGPDREKLYRQAVECGQADTVTFLGYDTNPYKYIARSQIFVCCSLSEGFSTAVTEALIVGTPVCTVDVSGMKEMLGDNNEYGIVTENNEDALYEGIKELLDNPELLVYYKTKASERGAMFSTKETVDAVEEMLLKL